MCAVVIFLEESRITHDKKDKLENNNECSCIRARLKKKADKVHNVSEEPS